MEENLAAAPTDWYVLHVLTGQEQKVQKSIEARARLEEMGAYIGQCVIPTEQIQEVRKGKKPSDNKKVVVKRKIFPGYVFVQLNLYGSKREFLEPTWRFIRETNGVLGFVGGDKPAPLTPSEVDNLINKQEESKEAPARPKVNFEPNEKIKIVDGPFMSFEGTVDEVDPEHGKLKVSVAIFGRSAPVELEYWQVEKFKNEEQTPAPNA